MRSIVFVLLGIAIFSILQSCSYGKEINVVHSGGFFGPRVTLIVNQYDDNLISSDTVFYDQSLETNPVIGIASSELINISKKTKKIEIHSIINGKRFYFITDDVRRNSCLIISVSGVNSESINFTINYALIYRLENLNFI